jgi:hypothetical protein
MPRISEKKREKISEQILHYLFSKFPKPLFTSDIAVEIARDEEFIKTLLIELEKKGYLLKITKNPEGNEYKRRLRWRLSNKTQETYSNLQ